MAADQKVGDMPDMIFYDAVEEVLCQILTNSPIYNHLFGPPTSPCLELVREAPHPSTSPTSPRLGFSIPGDLTFRFRSPPPTLPSAQTQPNTAKPDAPNSENTLQEHHLNSHRILHGSVSCTLVDLISGVCIASLGPNTTSTPLQVEFSNSSTSLALYPTREEVLTTSRGLSTDMSLQFLNSAKVGEEVWVRTWVKKRGRKLCWVGVQIWSRGENGKDKLVVEGSHTKYFS